MVEGGLATPFGVASVTPPPGLRALGLLGGAVVSLPAPPALFASG